MPDTQILRAGGAAPFDYTIPPSAELILKAVSATVDGSGAAGAFLPTLIIESDAGEIVAESDAPEVAAGATTRASWFPFVGAQAAAAASTWQGTLAAEQFVGTTQTVNAGAQIIVSWDEIKVDSSGTFSAGIGGAHPWTINTAGIYLVTLQILPSPNWPTAAQGPVVFRPDVPVGTVVFTQWSSYTPGSTNIGSFGAVVSTYGTAPAAWAATIQNQSSIAVTLTGGGPANNGTALSMNRLGPEVILT